MAVNFKIRKSIGPLKECMAPSIFIELVKLLLKERIGGTNFQIAERIT